MPYQFKQDGLLHKMPEIEMPKFDGYKIKWWDSDIAKLFIENKPTEVWSYGNVRDYYYGEYSNSLPSYPVLPGAWIEDEVYGEERIELRYQVRGLKSGDWYNVIDVTKYSEDRERRIVAVLKDEKGEFLANNGKPEYIICAAIYFKDDTKHVHQPKNIETGFVICGRRHHNCFIAKSMSEFSESEGSAEQGFLTSKDRFVSRKEAGEIALLRGQITRQTDCLFSEDLY